MHSRQLQYTAESFTAQQEALLHSRKFCCIVEKSVLRQKLEKSSFCGRNWRKVSSVVETEDKPTLQCLPLDLDSTFVHNLAAAKWYFEAHSGERQAQLPSQKKKRKKNPQQSSSAESGEVGSCILFLSLVTNLVPKCYSASVFFLDHLSCSPSLLLYYLSL